MMLGINLKLAMASIRSAKLRSLLTMFAVIIGVAAFVIITTTVEGMKASVSSQINDFGGNLITVNSGKAVERDEEGNITSLNLAASLAGSTLTEEDLKDISAIEGVSAAAPQAIVNATVKRGDKEQSGAFVLATNEDYLTAFNQSLESGEFIEGNDKSNRVVIGQGIVDDLFSGEVTLGTKIQIRSQDFTIVGIMERQESGFNFGFDFNNMVIISFQNAKELQDGLVLIQEIDVQATNSEDIDPIAEEISKVLLKNHDGEEDFTVLKQDEIVETTNGIFDIIKSTSQVISYIMLFVGSIVILLIMLITVSERTREIGIRKSIGASPNHIRLQFVIEALMLSWLGSLLGILLGYLLGFLVKSAIDITPVYTFNTLVVVVVISTIVGTLGGLYPAFRASRLDPVEALRYE